MTYFYDNQLIKMQNAEKLEFRYCENILSKYKALFLFVYIVIFCLFCFFSIYSPI